MRSSSLDLIQGLTAQAEGLADSVELGDSLNFLGLLDQLSAQNQFEAGLESMDAAELAEQSGLVAETATAGKFAAQAAEFGSSEVFETRACLAPAWVRPACGLFAASAEKSSEQDEASTIAPAA